MSESSSHKQAKQKAAGKSGETEVPLKSGDRLDAQTKIKAEEIERSGSKSRLKQAASRLKQSRKPQKVLTVPQKDMDKAIQAMKDTGVSGTVKNLGGTQRKRVRVKKKKGK